MRGGTDAVFRAGEGLDGVVAAVGVYVAMHDDGSDVVLRLGVLEPELGDVVDGALSVGQREVDVAAAVVGGVVLGG
jgi:hypothetical protein